jgi:hypothetical protein
MQVFVRDFVPSALAFLMNNEADMVKNFLLKTLHLQSSEKMVDRFKLGAGAMPASFKVDPNRNRNTETLVADFGESAIGRVAPVDSGFWWIILLRAYTKYIGDVSLSESPDCQKCMRLILNLCLSEGFDTFSNTALYRWLLHDRSSNGRSILSPFDSYLDAYPLQYISVEVGT